MHHAGDAYAFLAALSKIDPRFAVGVWYLAVLDGAFQRTSSRTSLRVASELVEIQLAVYILASWSKDLRRLDPGIRDPDSGVRDPRSTF